MNYPKDVAPALSATLDLLIALKVDTIEWLEVEDMNTETLRCHLINAAAILQWKVRASTTQAADVAMIVDARDRLVRKASGEDGPKW